VAAPAIYRNNAVGHVSFLLGDTLLEDVPAAELEAQALSGSQRFTGLYVALHGFELSLDAEFKRKLGDAYGLALGYASAPFFMQGIETVVLDLRSNNGGYRNTIFPFAFALMGDQFAKSAFIHEKSLSEFTPDVSKPQTNPTRWYVDKIDKRDPLFRLKPKHLIVLTSPYTCSAGELLIYGMREMLVPSAKITVIGEPTCGKPFGFPYQTYFGYQHAVINSATVDAQGQPAYSKGLQPDCTVRDDFKSDVLSSQDQLWQAARHYIKTGQCPSQNLAK
jgi:C-terminal processing protease CtpA/Prc